MLRLEHLNLVVKNIEKALTFYKAAFPHWEVRGSGDMKWYGVPRKWLHFGDEYQYLAFNDKGTGQNRDLKTNTLGLSHFAFEVKNLDAMIHRLKEAGFDIAKSGADSQYRKNVYYLDPDGYEVEFVEYLADEPELRNLYE